MSIEIYPTQKAETKTSQNDWSHERGKRANKRITTIIWIKKITKRFLMYWILVSSRAKDFCRIESYLELSSDHSPIMITVNSEVMTKSKSCTFHNAKINWFHFQELITIILDKSLPPKTDDYIIRTVEGFKHTYNRMEWNIDMQQSRHQYWIFICNKGHISRKKKVT